MRIALVTIQYPPHGVGGIGSYVETLARTLGRAGHDVTVLCVSDHHGPPTEPVGGVRVVWARPILSRRWRERFVKPRQRLRVRLLSAVSAAWALRRQQRRFDVIEAPEWKAQGLLLALARRGPVVTHVHLPLELEHAWNEQGMSRGAALACRLERLSATSAAARTATTRLSTRFPDGREWIPPESVELVAPPLDLERWRACPPVDGTRPVVLFVGRLERRKAPEVLVDALQLLADDVPDLRCVMVGRVMRRAEGSYDRFIKDRAAGLDVELRDPSADPEEVAALFGAARVVVVPSLFETLSMVVLEALASGRPAVMTDQVGAAELVGTRLPELIVPAGDPERLAAALRPLLVDVAVAQDVAMRGRDVVTDVCSPERVVESRLSVYRRLVADGAGS